MRLFVIWACYPSTPLNSTSEYKRRVRRSEENDCCIKKAFIGFDSARPLSVRGEQAGMSAVKIITARRGVLRTFAFTMATSMIGVASAATPSVAAVGSALMSPGATNLEALKKRLAQAPR